MHLPALHPLLLLTLTALSSEATFHLAAVSPSQSTTPQTPLIPIEYGHLPTPANVLPRSPNPTSQWDAGGCNDPANPFPPPLCFNRPTESVLPPLTSSSINPPTPYGATEGLSSPGPSPAQTYGGQNGQSDAGQQQPTSVNSQGGQNAAGMGGGNSQPVSNHSLRKAKSPITLLLICIAGSVLYKMGFWSDEPKEKKTKENDGEKDAKKGSERLIDEEKKPMERMDEDGDGVC